MLAEFEASSADNLSATASDPKALGRKFRYFSESREVPAKDLPLQLAVRENRAVAPVELEVQSPSGKHWFAQISGAPIRASDGQVTGGVAVVIDITDRKRAETALAAAAASAESANQAKDRFLASLSHELRTPLTPVIVAAQMLESEPDAGQNKELLDIVRRNVNMEARLIDDLLDLARVIHGKIQLRQERVNLHEVIRSAVNICKPQYDEKSLYVRLELNAAKSVVSGDSARIAQAFWNIFSNAHKFTPPCGTVRIVTESSDSTITAQISDTGSGISREVLPHIFNAFEQGQRGQFGGLGLGLAITKGILELHQGSIEVESEGEGKGTTFTVSLPLDQRASIEAPAPHSQVRESSSPKAVLVVEDHADTAGLIMRVLERRGHLVSYARNVKEAVNAIAERQYDVLLCDLGLPDGSGIDVIKESGSHRPRKTVALSGYGQPDDVRRCREAGFDEHVTKPVDVQALYRLVADSAH